MTIFHVKSLRGADIATEIERIENGFAKAHCLATPRWLPVLATAYRVKTALFIAERADGTTAGYLPVYYSDWSRNLFGLRHGLQVGDAGAAQSLISAAKDLAAAEGLSALDLGLGAASPSVGPDMVEAAGFEFDLSDCQGEAGIHALLSGHGRRALKAALRSGQELRAGPQELAPATQLYEQAMRRRGVRVHERAFLDQIATAFDDGFLPLVCYHDGTAVASAFLLIKGRYGAYLYGGTSERGMKLQSGSLLYFEMMRRCLTQGATIFDPGESSRGSGTYEFKRRFGARPTAVRYLRETLPRQEAVLSASAMRRRLASIGARALMKSTSFIGYQPQLRAALLGRRII